MLRPNQPTFVLKEKCPFTITGVIVDAWAGFWDSFWSHYKSLTTLIVMAILGYLVFKYELYTYSLSQWEELALASLLVFRDTGFVVVGSVLGLMAVVHVSSAIYRRRQRYVVG
jgi:hypothetical protein